VSTRDLVVPGFGDVPAGAFESSFLTLLLEGADISAFQGAFAEAREALSGGELHAAQDRLTHALAIREQLEEQRQRSRELGAIVETAADLAALRDVDALLQAICARARTLLATDAAWLTYDDPAYDHSHTRATHGIVSEQFQHIRLARDSGLGGFVVAEGTPQVTDDYLSDRRFVHTERFDAAVAAEGLRSVVGVPLRRGDDVIGVVLAGTRSPHRFTHRDIGLLESLAAHAAIALENSRLFQASQRAVQDLREADKRIRSHARAMERSVGLDARLMSLVLDGAGVEDLAEAIAEIVGGSLVVLDTQSRVLAVAGAAQEPRDAVDAALRATVGSTLDELPQELDEALLRARETHRAVALTDASGAPRGLISPMRAKSEALGELILTRNCVADAEQLLTRATTVVSLVLVNARNVAEAENRVRDELLNDIFRTPPVDPVVLAGRAARFGIDLDQPHAVVVAQLTDASRWTGVHLAQLAKASGGITGAIAGAHVVLLPDTDPEEAMTLVGQCTRGATATIGAAGPAKGVTALADAHAQASRTAQVLLALGRPGTKATARQLGFFGLVCEQAGENQLKRFVEDAIGAVIAYDVEHSTMMLTTMETFFGAGGHMANTAAALRIHVNTLYQRLDRISQILGPTWRKPDERLQLHLATRLHRLAAGLEQAAA
jgi:GAF domain-containing protein